MHWDSMDRAPGGGLNSGRIAFIRAFPRPQWPVIRRAMLGLILAAAGRTQAGQCGTAIYFEKHRQSATAAQGALRVAAGEPANRARTLETDHFLFHYSLRGLHRVHTEPEDSTLVRTADSLFAAFKDMADPQRDSAAYARLDSAHLAHPVYIRKTAQYFEAARAYYVDRLGMLAPVSSVRSVQYQVPASLSNKFPVDIVDIGTADNLYAGETYGITYPPPQLSITFENDFLCRTKLDDNGNIVGDPIASRLAGKVIHDYSREWELGIKVTAFHEFYHAVQFTYIPRVVTYHAWYELSATGMEERNAGEVDDYLQYLPCVLNYHNQVPLNSLLQGPCTHYPMYGHSIFHQYLSKALDSAFDVRVWEQLRRNGDALQDGLETAFGKYGRTMASLYPDYVSQLFFSGNRFKMPDGLFSPDMDRWPNVSMDSIDMSGSNPHKVVTLPALTFGILKVKWGNAPATRILQAKVASGITRIHADAAGFEVEHLRETQFPLAAPHSGYGEYYLVLPNPSFTEKAAVEIKEADAVFYAFPNPVRAQTGAVLYFSQAKSMVFPSRVRIYGEDGREVVGLDFPSAEQVLTWDLMDAGKQLVKAGVYYYRLNEDPLRLLLVMR